MDARRGTRDSSGTRPRLASRVFGFLLALLALPSGARAQSRLSPQEALQLAFPAPDSVVRRTAFLSASDVARVTAQSGPGADPPPSVVSYYVAWQKGQPVGVAYFDTHKVRTERETLMFVLDRTGTIRRVEVLAFGEPPEYAAPRGWLGQFAGVDSSDGAALKGRIVAITGATLTTRAAERAARRILALHHHVHPFAATARP